MQEAVGDIKLFPQLVFEQGRLSPPPFQLRPVSFLHDCMAQMNFRGPETYACLSSVLSVDPLKVACG